MDSWLEDRDWGRIGGEDMSSTGEMEDVKDKNLIFSHLHKPYMLTSLLLMKYCLRNIIIVVILIPSTTSIPFHISLKLTPSCYDFNSTEGISSPSCFKSCSLDPLLCSPFPFFQAIQETPTAVTATADTMNHQPHQHPSQKSRTCLDHIFFTHGFVQTNACFEANSTMFRMA